ncbi:MAG TPA: peptidoglycan recognition family protein [Phycisphaerae bacterium]|nr:peptidoglycan recognition family protein [Phycisphaerae bacterium]
MSSLSSQPTPPAAGADAFEFSRRFFLGALGLAAAGALLTGCENAGAGDGEVMSSLPNPIDRTAPRKLPVPDSENAPPAPPRPLPPPVVAKEPTGNYGILPRSMWAKAGPDLSRVDPMDGVRLITFHHSGDPKPFLTSDFGETAQHLEYVREYHRSRNFQDIGYHFAIDRAGRVWQLRSLRYQGQHVRYNNEHNVGVVVLGNFDLQAMTQAQKDKVKVFGSLLRKQYGLPIAKVYTHQEIVSTECPGNNMQPYMVAVRKQRLI